MKPDRDRIRVEIVALPDTPSRPDHWQRLRLILKRLLRAHGWRAVQIEPVDAKSESEAKT